MKDASRVIADTDAAGDARELRERLDLVGHYIDYTLRYCSECPLIEDEPKECLPFRTINLPGAS